MIQFDLPGTYREEWVNARQSSPDMPAAWVGRVAWLKTMERLKHRIFWDVVICGDPIDPAARDLYITLHDRQNARYLARAKSREALT